MLCTAYSRICGVHKYVKVANRGAEEHGPFGSNYSAYSISLVERKSASLPHGTVQELVW